MLTVRNLIEILEQCPPHKLIVVRVNDFYIGQFTAMAIDIEVKIIEDDNPDINGAVLLIGNRN